MRFDTKLVGGASEDILVIRPLLEVLRRYPDIMGRIDSKFNRVLARMETLENTSSDSKAGPGSKAEVFHRGLAKRTQKEVLQTGEWLQLKL